MKRGFTLIELLVVISIIALLSSIILVGVAEARDKARITAYVQSLYQTRIALELYKDDMGYYPLENLAREVLYVYMTAPGVFSDNMSADFIAEGFLPTYIAEVPKTMDYGDEFDYWNKAFVDYYVSTRPNAKCGDVLIAGKPYLIFYWSNTYPTEIPLKRLNPSGIDLDNQYCLLPF